MTVRYSDDAQASRFAAQAYAALVLARQQKAPLGALREIWSRHDQARSGLPLLQLGVALKLMGDAPRGDEALKLAMATPRQDANRWLGDYGSELRDDALKLALLEENKLLPEAQIRYSAIWRKRHTASAGFRRRRVTPCSWPGVRCRISPAAGRRKPPCRPNRSPAIRRKPAT